MEEHTTFFASSSHTVACDNYSTPMILPEGHQFRGTGIMVNPLRSVRFAVTTGTVTINVPAMGIPPTQQDNCPLHSKTPLLHLFPIFLGGRRSMLLSRDRAGRKGIILFSSMALSSNCLMQEIAPTAEPFCLLSWKPGPGTI